MSGIDDCIASRVSRGAWPGRIACSLLVPGASLLFAAAAHAGGDDVVTVGDGGYAANCTRATLSEAIAFARDNGRRRILVTRSTRLGYHLDVAARIDGMELEIVGGYDDCWDGVPSGLTHLSGNRGTRAPVLSITGESRITLRNLAFELGDPSGTDSGGGIDFAGKGALILDNVLLRDNVSAGDGGGVSVRAVGGEANLALRGPVQFVANRGRNGGGLSVRSTDFPATLLATGTIEFHGNRASASGGGLHVSRTTNALIAGSLSMRDNHAAESGGGMYLAHGAYQLDLDGSRGSPAFFDNQATNGGGLAIGSSASVHLYSNNAEPVVLSANAADYGGAISVENYGTAQDPSASFLCVRNANLSWNSATGGGAAVFAGGTRAFVAFDPAATNARCTFLPRATECVPARSECNRIDHNIADAGDVVHGHSSASISLRNVFMHSNVGRSMLGNLSPLGQYSLLDSVVARNTVLPGGALFLAGSSDQILRVEGSTIAANLLPAGAPVVASHPLGLVSVVTSIVDQPANRLIDLGQFHNLEWVLVPPGSFAPPPPPHRVLVGTPVYASRAPFGEFELDASSIGIDVAPARPAATGVDAAGNPRDRDVGTIPDIAGPRDLGAFEFQPPASLPELLSDGFEDP